MKNSLHLRLWTLSRKLHQRGYQHAARAAKGLNFFLHKTLLPVEAIVGENLILDHFGVGVVMHPQVTIGNHCRIYHHVTLASEVCIGSEHRIFIGDHVTIGAHSIIVGRGGRSMYIGGGAVIGAGSVVTKDVPAHEVWAGNPARKIRDTNQGESSRSLQLQESK